MPSVDDLNNDDLVVLIEHKCDDPMQGHCASFSGVPLQIVSISLPFLAVTDGKEMMTVDVRYWKVARCTSEYAKALTAGRLPNAVKAARTRNAVPDEAEQEPIRHNAFAESAQVCPTCPTCGSPMMSVRVASMTSGPVLKTLWACRKCAGDDKEGVVASK